MDLIIPMAGRGNRFSKEGYQKPKPFLDLAGKSMIEGVLESINLPARVILIMNAGHLEYSEQVRNTIELIRTRFKEVVVIESTKELKGAATTALEAREFLDPTHELSIAYCDQIMDWDAPDFMRKCRNGEFDGVITTYKNNEPKDDFIDYEEESGLVKQLIPKQVISDLATIGLYYWKSSGMFLEGADTMIKKGITHNNEFYIGPVFNENILSGYKIGYYTTGVHQVGNPVDFEKYQKFLKNNSSN